MITTIMVATALFQSGCGRSRAASANSTQKTSLISGSSLSGEAVTLSASQLTAIKIEPASIHPVVVEKEGIGNIDFESNVYFDNDRSIPVFPPRQGTIRKTFIELGDEVQVGQPLYSIDSPDLAEAESALLDSSVARDRFGNTVAPDDSSDPLQNESGQVVADQLSAERAYKTKREAVRALGKSESEIDQILAAHKIDSELIVRSPISGQISSVNVMPGILVQPERAPAPCSVADVSTKWMLAKVTESDWPLFRVGQPAKVTVAGYPHRIFNGRISKIYPTVDPNTHRITVRSEIADPANELRSGMIAEFVIQVEQLKTSIAIPVAGVVREGDGTMTTWVTTDRHRFVQRIVKTGPQNSGWVQILSGLRRGELVVTDGAVFLDNMLQSAPSD